MAEVFVCKSKIHGIGVVAARDFQKGETVLEIDDSRIVNEENPLNPAIGEFEYHCDYLESGKTVLMKSPERHINSSCDPVCFVKTIEGIRYVTALKNIKSGEEITYDYIINCHGGEVWQCNCRSQKCRKRIVSSFFDLPIELQLEYLPLLDDWFIKEHKEKIDKLKLLNK